MRTILVAIFAVVCVLGPVSRAPAGTYQSAGSYVGSPGAPVSRLFAAFPNGGDDLVTAIRQLLINNPSLADDVVFLASRGNAAQQQAAADGMAQGLIVLTSRGDNYGAGIIVSAAQLGGIPVIQQTVLAAAATAISSSAAEEIKPPQTAANCMTTTTAPTVSPARPATTTTTCQ